MKKAEDGLKLERSTDTERVCKREKGKKNE